MKRILILTSAIILVAAACNKQAPVSNTQNQTNQNDQPQAQAEQQIDMSGWKTYKNDKIGFQLNYPLQFTIVENPTVNDLPIASDFGANVALVVKNSDGSFGDSIAIKRIHSSIKDAV